MNAPSARWTYNVDGLVSEIRQATGLASPNDWTVTSLAFETTARVRAVTDPDGRVTRFLYDALNRPVLTIDAEGRTVGSVYDAEGQVLQERRGDGSTAPIVYAGRTWTANGKLLTVTTPTRPPPPISTVAQARKFKSRRGAIIFLVSDAEPPRPPAAPTARQSLRSASSRRCRA